MVINPRAVAVGLCVVVFLVFLVEYGPALLIILLGSHLPSLMHGVSVK
jgi:hypothetical protein